MSRFPHIVTATLREALPVAVVALLVFQGCRLLVAERYRVPTPSMEPTLHGDARAGDVVLVEMVTARFGARPARYDMVVVRSPDRRGGHVVKRAVAFGDDPEGNWLRLDDGDLWLGSAPDRLRRVEKDPMQARDLRVPWCVHPAEPGADQREELPFDPGPGQVLADRIVLAPGGAIEAVREALTPDARRRRWDELPPRVLPEGFAGLDRAVDTTWVDAAGRRGGSHLGPMVVNDFGAEARLVAGTGVHAVLAVLTVRTESMAWEYRADGTVTFLHNGQPAGPVVSGGPRLAPGVPLELEFGLLDGRLFLTVDGRLLDLRPRPEISDVPDLPPVRGAPRNGLCFGVTGGTVDLTRLRVFRDLYWFQKRDPFRERREVQVPPGHLYLLGDNSMDSEDSRAYGPLPLTAYVGRPWAVLGPWPRFRVLDR